VQTSAEKIKTEEQQRASIFVSTSLQLPILADMEMHKQGEALAGRFEQKMRYWHSQL
jgi:hypothetical protein